MVDSRENPCDDGLFAPVLAGYTTTDLTEAGRGFLRVAGVWLQRGKAAGVANLLGGLVALIADELNRRDGSALPDVSPLLEPVDLVGVPLEELAEALELLERLAAEIEQVPLERSHADHRPGVDVDPGKVAQLWRVATVPLGVEVERRHQVVRSALSPPRTV